MACIGVVIYVFIEKIRFNRFQKKLKPGVRLGYTNICYHKGNPFSPGYNDKYLFIGKVIRTERSKDGDLYVEVGLGISELIEQVPASRLYLTTVIIDSKNE